MSNGRAVIAWCDPGVTAGAFTESLANMLGYSAAKGICDGIMRRQSGPVIEDARNAVVSQFLETQNEWLLMVDADMTFGHDALEKLLDAADPDTAPVVGGLCYTYNDESGPAPTVYRWHPAAGLHVDHAEYGTQVVPVDATGAAFLLTHREVFEKYRRRGEHEDVLPWFRRSVHTDEAGSRLVGEDLDWCLWLRQNDVPIYVHHGVEVGHVKQWNWNRGSYRAFREGVPGAAD